MISLLQNPHKLTHVNNKTETYQLENIDLFIIDF